jgi:hypothetical protein
MPSAVAKKHYRVGFWACAGRRFLHESTDATWLWIAGFAAHWSPTTALPSCEANWSYAQIRAAHGSEVGKSPKRCAKPREQQMVKNALLCFALASTGVIGAALELGVNYALAADDCITESNLVPPKGTRWDYRIDRAGNRKCWFLMKVTIAPVAPQTRRPLPRSTLARISPKHRSVRNLSESEQAALFLEFLRWKEQQSAVNSNAAESLRGTIGP